MNIQRKDKMPKLAKVGVDPADMVRAAKAKKKGTATTESVVNKILRK